MEEPKWYVVHTYSGYENKVKTNLENSVRSDTKHNFKELIRDVRIPLEKSEDGKFHKLFPGYVFVQMVHTDDTWYVVRNTRGVTGFVGPDGVPHPLSEEDLVHFGLAEGEPEDAAPAAPVTCEFEVGDLVEITSDSFHGTKTVIQALNVHKQTATVMVEVFNSETKMEINLADLKKVD